jgi:DNA-binding CsgD family transcriptional regulator/transcriptional regulator with PAS, ATPase and Fis domain
MPTGIDQKEELVRGLGRLGIGLRELIASFHDEIVVLDRERRVVAVLGDALDESPRRSEDQIGKTLREMFGAQPAAAHEAAHIRAIQGERVAYEWTRRKGRQPLRLSTTASPLRDSASGIVGVVLVTRDISPAGRDDKRFDASAAQKTKRLLELEHGIQQLAGAIENYRKTGPSLREWPADSPLRQLSSRERQVLDLLGQGYRPRSIAEKLHVSPETVRNHLKAMFKKTGTHSQEELTAMLRLSD